MFKECDAAFLLSEWLPRLGSSCLVHHLSSALPVHHRPLQRCVHIAGLFAWEALIRHTHLCPCCLQSQVFREYAAAYGWYGLLFIICMWAMEQTCRVLTNWWLSRWSTAESVAAYLHSLGELHCFTMQRLL